TSFLIDESKNYSEEEMARAVHTAAAPAVGAQAVQGSAALKTLAEADTVQASVENVRIVGDRAYFLKDGIWIDSTYNDQETLDIIAYSPAHFDLVSLVPWIAPHLALGEHVIIRVGEVYVQVGDTGLERVTEEIIDLLS
ncbi:MAG: hypothetical protein U9N00_02765, partial [Candidatus Bipolaricaulota bacterium]|nr:hypothetical protein [Candidatus Bipolaricaulota bacterium]